nr:MAG TPA: hypothetical protein [Ackermannviridae sp.]
MTFCHKYMTMCQNFVIMKFWHTFFYLLIR